MPDYNSSEIVDILLVLDECRGNYHPYHINLHQDLHGTDFENRVTFYQWVQHQMYINNEFLSSILFTNETSFTNYSLANLHNMHYWSDENPH